jgi:hypothetical protein
MFGLVMIVLNNVIVNALLSTGVLDLIKKLARTANHHQRQAQRLLNRHRGLGDVEAGVGM